MSRPPLGFIPDPLTLPLDRILPSRKTPEGLHTSRKFKQIMASMEAVGLIEPLSEPTDSHRHTYKWLTDNAVCVCHGEEVGAGFERR